MAAARCSRRGGACGARGSATGRCISACGRVPSAYQPHQQQQQQQQQQHQHQQRAWCRLSRSDPSWRAHAASNSSTNTEAAAAAAAADSRDEALLVAYCACQNRSLFAAQCFVEAVLDAFTCGVSVDALATSLQLKAMAQGGGSGALLQPQDQDLLLSWIILVMLTAQEVGVAARGNGGGSGAAAAPDTADAADAAAAGCSSSPAAREAAAAAAGITQSYRREVLGLLGFVKQSAKLYFDEGYSVTKLQSLQATVASDPGAGQSQALQMMQQYSRLVLITLEVAAGCRLPTTRPLTNPTSLDAPSGYTAAFSVPLQPQRQAQQPPAQQAPEAAAGQQASSAAAQPAPPCCGLVSAAALAAGRGGLRAHAVLLMTSFVGAVIGSPYCLRAFVLSALAAYEAGVPASSLHAQLAEHEFAQSGGLVPALPQPEVTVAVNSALFGRWLSLVYMAAAQQNAVFPGATDHPQGWAWYGGEDEVQANAMAAFVAQRLSRLQQQAADERAAHDAGAQGGQQQVDQDTASPREDALVSRIKSSPDAAQQLAAASAQLQRELAEKGTLRGKAVPVMVKVPDPSLEATSGAVRLWKQQLQLVEAVYAYMHALHGGGGGGAGSAP